jgi:hypothetical protein
LFSILFPDEDFKDEPDEEKGITGDDDDDDDGGFNDEDRPSEMTAGGDSRDRLYLIVGACCCLVVIGLAVGLGVGLGLKDDDPAPAPVPTRPPTSPPTIINVTFPPTTDVPVDTPAPTMMVAPGPPNVAVVTTSRDTTIYTNGIQQLDTHGDQTTMLVQRGPEGDGTDLPSAYALVQFDISLEEYPWFEGGEMAGETSNATMCLYHVVDENVNPSDENVTIDERTYSVCLLPPTVVDIEQLTGETTPYKIPDTCVGREDGVTTFTLSPSDTQVCFDATNLIFQDIAVAARGRRQLQDVVSYLIMIDNLVEDDTNPGDMFYTRLAENSTLYPSLTIEAPSNNTNSTNNTDVPVTPPSVSVQPSMSISPSWAPSESAQPSISSAPTFVPTITSSPTLTNSPTVTYSPSISYSPNGQSAPVLTPVNQPCNICGVGQTIATFDGQVTLPAGLVIPGNNGTLSCLEAEILCFTGNCDAEVCAAFPAEATEACGCAAANPSCNFCGVGQEVTMPDAVVDIPADILPGLPESLSCGLGENLCNIGACSPDICMLAPEFVGTTCGCAAT